MVANKQLTPQYSPRTPAAQPQSDNSTVSSPHGVDFGNMGRVKARYGQSHGLLAEAVNSYIIAQAAYRRSPSTIKIYRRVLGGFVRFLEDQFDRGPLLDDLSTDNARRFLLWRQQTPRYICHPFREPGGSLSPSTLNQDARCLRALARWLHEEGHTEVHRLAKLRLPKVPDDQPQPLGRADVEQLLRSLDQSTINGRRTGTFIALLYDTGMRSGEMVRLSIADVQFDTGEILILGKGEKRRTVVAGSLALRYLRRYLDVRRDGLGNAGNRIFVNKTGRPASTGDVAHVFKRLGNRCGFPDFHPHLLRHSFAVQFLRNGGDVLTLQRLLGHASVATTNRYVLLATADLVDSHRRNSPLDNS